MGGHATIRVLVSLAVNSRQIRADPDMLISHDRYGSTLLHEVRRFSFLPVVGCCMQRMHDVVSCGNSFNSTFARRLSLQSQSLSPHRHVLAA